MQPTPTRFEKRTFGVLLAVAGVFFLWTVSPIWVPVFLGILLAVVASPLHRQASRDATASIRACSAAAISFVTVALGLGLVVFMGYFVLRELLHYLTDMAPKHAAAAEHWLHGVARVAHPASPWAVARRRDEAGPQLRATRWSRT